MTVQSIIIPALDVICLKPQGKVRMSYWGILSREASNLKGIYGIVLIFGMVMLQIENKIIAKSIRRIREKILFLWLLNCIYYTGFHRL
jgi:hypothetical protein